MVTAKKENLNIDWHVRRVVLIALNLSSFKFQAASVLGVSESTLMRKRKEYNIIYCKNLKKYIVKDKPGEYSSADLVRKKLKKSLDKITERNVLC